MKGFADAMAQVGSPISDDELIDYIVFGLGPQYESLQHSLTVLAAAGVDTFSLADFYSMLLSCESLKEQNALAPEFSTSANAAARQGDGRGRGLPFADTNNDGRSGGRPTGPQGSSQYNGGQQQQAPMATALTRGRWWWQRRRRPGQRRWWAHQPPARSPPLSSLQVLGA